MVSLVAPRTYTSPAHLIYLVCNPASWKKIVWHKKPYDQLTASDLNATDQIMLRKFLPAFVPTATYDFTQKNCIKVEVENSHINSYWQSAANFFKTVQNVQDVQDQLNVLINRWNSGTYSQEEQDLLFLNQASFQAFNHATKKPLTPIDDKAEAASEYAAAKRAFDLSQIEHDKSLADLLTYVETQTEPEELQKRVNNEKILDSRQKMFAEDLKEAKQKMEKTYQPIRRSRRRGGTSRP